MNNTKNIKNTGKNKLTKKINKLKEYTLDDVAKHNKKTDAWIAINGKVANITKWIPKHPGGNVIMKGVGRDATSLFNSIGHDDYAKKMVKKYQIGILKK
jgi:cytochrome b involved in lipid metabolism